MQARSHVSPAVADVVIFNVGEKGAEALAIEAAAARSNISIITVNANIIEGMHIVFARLFFDRFAPANYDKFIYIDGDTQVSQSLEPLFHYPLAPDRFLASRDPLVLLNDRDSTFVRRLKSRWNGIGMRETDYVSYVNAGVFVANRESWKTISQRSIELYKSDPERYEFMDQDVINIVGRNQIDIMSFRWNFPGFLMGLGYEEIVQPHLYHFMSNPRPWHGPFQPWGSSWHKPYLELERRHPELACYRPKLSRLIYAKYIAQQRYKRVIEMQWNQDRTRNRMRELEASTVI